MIRQKICATLLICLAWAVTSGAYQQIFPEWRGSNAEIVGDWIDSQIVAVGDVVNVAPYGAQKVGTLPWPMSPDVHTLYWCVGDFRPTAVVKGELQKPPRRYLWASAQPGCKLWYGNQSSFDRLLTRVWFLRVEGDFLRPTYDGGTSRVFGLLTRWEQGPDLPPRERLGVLLLTPNANSDTLEDYAHYLWNAGDIACELLGKAKCAQRIRALAELGNPILQDAACNYLKGQLGETCRPR